MCLVPQTDDLIDETSSRMEVTRRIFMIEQVVGSPKLNVKGLVHSEQVYRGIVDCFSKTYKEAGIRGLYRGVGMFNCSISVDFVQALIG